MRFKRVKPIFKDDFLKIKNSRVLILGVGGVGGYCLDCLYRSGVEDIDILDFDTFDITNQNRQIGSEFVGEKKTKVLSKIYPGVVAIDMKLTPEIIKKFDFGGYDVVVDAIDDLSCKVELSHAAYEKLVSSCGAAKRKDPTKIEIASIWDTKSDPFAKKFRYLLKKSGFKGDFSTVYSTENPIKSDELGSFVGVTGAMGLTLGYLAIKKIVS